MNKYSKFRDINAVLEKVEKSLAEIESKYRDSLQEKIISDELLVEVKDFLGNIKSSLDYLRKKVSKHNFPVCETEKDFNNRTTDLSPEIKKVIFKWQPFQGNEWLSWLNVLNNESKHVTLIPQERIETKQVKISKGKTGISMSGGASIPMGKGCSISIGGAVIPGGQTISPDSDFFHDKRLSVEKTTWVDFRFNHEKLPKNISVLNFLKESFKKTRLIVKELEILIDN